MKTEHMQTQQNKGGRLYILYIKFDNFDDIESLGDKKDYSMYVPIINNVNVNIKMYKKWKIKMYNLGSTIHQLSYHQ